MWVNNERIFNNIFKFVIVYKIDLFSYSIIKYLDVYGFGKIFFKFFIVYLFYIKLYV